MREYICEKGAFPEKNLYALERAWPLHVGKFPSKYSSSINSLIRKIIIFENSQFGQLLTYKQISILSSFMREYLCEKGNFPAYWVRIRKGVVKCWLCTSIEVTRPLYAEEFPSEYLDNRKTLMRKTVHFENGQFGQFQTHQQIPIVSIFMSEYISAEKGNSWPIVCTLERAWSNVYCIQVQKCQVFHTQRNPLLQYNQ